MGLGNESLFKRSRSPDQDSHHAHIVKTLRNLLLRCNNLSSLSCPPATPPPPVACPRGHFIPGLSVPTWFILSPGTLYPGPPLKFISYLFFFYNFYSATYFIALKIDKIKTVAAFAPELSECTLHLFSYVSLHDCIVLINVCYTALGLLFQSCP